MFNGLRQYDEDNNDEVEGEADFRGVASRWDQNDATGPLPNQSDAHITKTHAYINLLYQNKTVEINMINN